MIALSIHEINGVCGLYGISLTLPQELNASGVMHVRLARPASVYRIDPRVKFDASKLDLIKTRVRTRIFDEGLNSFDSQTLPALSYQSPRGFYRYKEGQLFNSISVTQNGDQIILEFRYPEVILNVLEDRYGYTFLFSPSDKEYIDKLVLDSLTALGLRPLGELGDAERKALQDNPALRDQYEQEKKLADEIRKANVQSEDDAIATLVAEKEAYEKAKVEKPTRAPARTREPEPPIEREAGNKMVTHDLEYDSRATLYAVDYQEFAQDIKNRIRILNKDASDLPIKAEILPQILDNPTINSIVITKPRAGLLRLKVTYKDLKIPPLETQYGAVFDWSPSDIAKVDAKVKLRLGVIDINSPQKPTAKI